MFFNSFLKKYTKRKNIQYEYVDCIKIIMNSPLWDGSNEQIYQSLPNDLNPDTIEYVKSKSNFIAHK